jgi:general L-amino acid transport system substrate-binding protein
MVSIRSVWAGRLKQMVRRRSLLFLIIGLLTFSCSLLPAEDTLTTVMNRGRVICGVDGQRPGFSFQSPDGEYSGLDADYCRAIASALFDDPGKVEFRRVGELRDLLDKRVDILLGNMAWTIERDGAMDFAPPVFYDGQGLLAAADFPAVKGEVALERFERKTICVEADTDDAAVLNAFFQRFNISINAVMLESENEVFINFVNGNCELVTAKRSELAIRRQRWTNPERYQLLDLALSQEPIAPMVRSHDSRWLDVVRWVIYGTFRAEELGVSRNNVMGVSGDRNPEILRFLGVEGDYGIHLGIPNVFMKRVIRHVGNYGEIYQRNIGQPLRLERGINELWVNGGLMNPMLFR